MKLASKSGLSPGHDLAAKEREITYLHECPVCGKGHRVNAVRHALAYGRQLTCCCECESRRRMKWRRP